MDDKQRDAVDEARQIIADYDIPRTDDMWREYHHAKHLAMIALADECDALRARVEELERDIEMKKYDDMERGPDGSYYGLSPTKD